MPQPQQPNPGSSLSTVYDFMQNMMGQHQLQQAAAQGGGPPGPGGPTPGPAMPGVQQAIAPQTSSNPIAQAMGKLLLGKSYDPVRDQDPTALNAAVKRYMAEGEYKKTHGGKPMPPPAPEKHSQADTASPILNMFHGLMDKLGFGK